MRQTHNRHTEKAFSLVEVVLAIGVIAFAVVAILGVFPIGLSTSHSAQDNTRACEAAEKTFAYFASQAQANFSNVSLPLSSPAPPPSIDLSASNRPITTPAAFLYIDNAGQISQSPANAAYSLSIGTNNAPPGYSKDVANAVTIRVVSPPLLKASDPTGTNRMDGP